MDEFGLDWRKLPTSDTEFGKLFIKYDDLGTSSAQNLGQRHCKNEMSRSFVPYSNYRYMIELVNRYSRLGVCYYYFSQCFSQAHWWV